MNGKAKRNVPLALGADFVAVYGEVFANAGVELVECDGETLHHVFGASGALREAAHAVAENGGQNVVEIGVFRVGNVLVLLQAVRTELVVDLSLLLVGEYVIRFLYFFELIMKQDF